MDKVKDDSIKCSLDDCPDETRAPVVSKSEGNNEVKIDITAVKASLEILESVGDNKGATDFPKLRSHSSVSQ